ncbi:MAG: aldolase/citrate lyase family protein [Pseudomonadota bacterium]
MTSFKDRLVAGHPLVGTFMKTPSPMLCEVFGRSALDVICLDAEHSPFDRGDLDRCVFSLKASGKPALVRVPSCQPEHILNALDLGADGILAPHIITKADAEALVDAATFGQGRGYSGSTRAAGYMAKTMAQHLEGSKGSAALIAQIEDAAALDNVGDILSVDGIDCVFIGRADLTVSLGYDTPAAAPVVEAVEAICKAAKAAGRPSGMFTSDLSELGHWKSLGASLFLLGSDHSFLLAGAKQLTDTAEAQLEP